MQVKPRTIFILCLLLFILPMIPAHAQEIDYNAITFEDACGSVTIDNPTPNDVCLNVMAVRPAPSYAEVPMDRFTMGNFSFWRATNEPEMFDAPNGNLVRRMEPGFNFVRAVNETDAWVQIESGEWIRRTDIEYVEPSKLRGLQINDNLRDPFAWVLGNVITAPYPAGPQSLDTGVRMWRYNLVNIYATVNVGGWNWYMVGPNKWIDQRMVARPTPVARPEGVAGHWMSVDLYEQTLVAYEDDTPVFATVIASGLSEWETNEGLFEVWYRIETGGMSGAAGAPDAYALQSVPWTMYFDGDISLHGTYWHDGFGFRRSHGCVNLSISDSRWLYEWTAAASYPLNENNRPVTYVYVHSSGEYQ